jgi:lipopolysaccharide transport system ATP-binding protein
MAELAIRVEKLSKRYGIGALQHRHDTLRDGISEVGSRISDFMRRANSTRRIRNPQWSIANPQSSDTIWALRDVSFEVKRGEVVGIIGRNGAGKSTLLKILSRITEPTEGRAEIHGRVGSLLEVGTGFHPELTGRENIYLNGAILGMRRVEITRRFDEIVAFAEIERFLDTPVKRYSSGMYVRLAFAVAAHLEPQILLVDEVLAVGDAAFQRKCLGKMGDVAKEGRTVLFVSHNMAAVANLCQWAVLLGTGVIEHIGPSQEVIRVYLQSLRARGNQELASRVDRQGAGKVRFTGLAFEDLQGSRIEQPIAGQPLVIALDYASSPCDVLRNCRASVAVYDSLGQVLFNCSTELTNHDSLDLPAQGTIRCVIERLPLSQGRYLISPFFEVNREVEDYVDGAAALDVVDGDFYGTGRLYPEGWRGKGVLIPHHWVVDHN